MTLTPALFGALDFGALPSVAPGIGAGLGIAHGAFPWLRIEGSAALWPSITAAAGTQRESRFTLRAFDLGACVLIVRDARWELAPCLSAELAWILGQGVSETTPGRGDATWLALRGTASAAYFVTQSFGFRLDMGAGVALARPAFVVQGPNGGLVHKPAGVTGRTAFGVELRF